MSLPTTSGDSADDADLRARLGAAARVHAHDRFDTSIVIPRIEQLYRDLLEKRA